MDCFFALCHCPYNQNKQNLQDTDRIPNAADHDIQFCPSLISIYICHCFYE